MSKPLTKQQEVLEGSKDRIRRRYPDWADELYTFLERDESAIVYANAWDNPDLGAIRLGPTAAIAKQFDISLEIPILIATFSGMHRLEPRVLRHLDTSPQLRSSSSADKDFAILVASDSKAHEFVKDRKRFAFPILVLMTDDLQSGAYRNKSLRGEMARLLRSMNHFDFSNEIRESADFFGRLDELDALVSLAAAGQSVGIFGLRRAGKTSLLYQVADQLRARGTRSVYVQLNAIIDADDLRETIVSELARLTLESGKTIPSNSEMLHSDGTIQSIDTVSRRWIYEVNGLLDVIGEDIVVFLDETDLANEDAAEFEESEISERRALYRVLQQLRGLIQIRNDRAQTKLSFVSAGVAASLYTSAIRFGKDNQLFGFASARFLGPMTRDDMRHMVRSLGKRSGLKFDSFELFNMLFSEYGGHPHLTRQACSRVAEAVQASDKDEVPHRVSVADLQLAFAFMGEGSPAHAAWQTFQSFSRWYPAEAEIVHEVARTGAPAKDVNLITHAIAFGLCDNTGRLRLGALRRSAQ
ncbi:MAG: ATP-binding protein [Actinobacteria bacterium]|nr:ATP-binding protein [Actinomycetota bacterium]